MMFYGYFIAATVSVLAVWGVILWSMTRSVYPARRAEGEFGLKATVPGKAIRAGTGGWLDGADDALRAADELTRREEERTQTKRLNAIFESEANYHRAA